MQYRLIALDLDGTLTNSEKRVSERNKEAIRKAAEKGAKVVLASGRPIIGIEPVAEEINLKEIGGYLLGYNGGHIIDYQTGETLIRRTVPEECYEEICRMAKAYPGVDVLTYDRQGLIATSDTSELVTLEARINKVPIHKYEDLYPNIDGPVIKFLCLGAHETLKEIQQHLMSKYPTQLNIFFSEVFFLEIVPPGIEKSTSLELLIDKLGMTRDNLIACGDGFNDITMINYAGMGVAMENAQDAVKERADYITDTNDEDGVAVAIEKFVLEEE